MTPEQELSELREFQRIAAENFHGPLNDYHHKAGAWQGITDALLEESFILLEAPIIATTIPPAEHDGNTSRQNIKNTRVMKLKIQLSRKTDFRGSKGSLQAFVMQEGFKGPNLLGSRSITNLDSAKMEVQVKLAGHEIEFLPFEDPYKPPPPKITTPRDNYGLKGMGPTPKRANGL